MTATLGVTEDQIFDAVWQTVTQFFASTVTPYIFKGFQNSTAVPAGVSYIVISPGMRTTQGQGLRDYDTTNLLQIVRAHRTYDYQVDCFGANGPIWADLISAAWKSPWVADYATLNALPFAPADLRHESLELAWLAYRAAWRSPEVRAFITQCRADPRLLRHANETWPMGLE